MAYVHGQREAHMTTSGGAPVVSTTGGLLLRYQPGYQPVVVRAAAVQNTTTIIGVIPPVITFWESSIAGGASGNWTSIDTITMATGITAPQGQLFFVEDLQTKIEPGHEVVAQITTVSTEAVLIRATLYVESTTDAPSGNTQMTESA